MWTPLVGGVDQINKLIPKTIGNRTREMQGIVGQASDFVEVISKIDNTLLHKI